MESTPNNIGTLITVGFGFATTIGTLFFQERRARDERKALALQVQVDKQEAADALAQRLTEQRESQQMQASTLKSMLRDVGSDAKNANEAVRALSLDSQTEAKKASVTRHAIVADLARLEVQQYKAEEASELASVRERIESVKATLDTHDRAQQGQT